MELAQRYPEKILRICIRNSHGEMHDDNRFSRIFKDLANDRWVVFDDANQLLNDERWMTDVQIHRGDAEHAENRKRKSSTDFADCTD